MVKEANTEVSTQQTSHENPLADFGPNEWIVDEMYQRYLADPSSVDPAWHDFFADYKPAMASGSIATPDQATAANAKATAAKAGTDAPAAATIAPEKPAAPAPAKAPAAPAPAKPAAKPAPAAAKPAQSPAPAEGAKIVP